MTRTDSPRASSQTPTPIDPTATFRRGIYAMLIALSLAWSVARIATVHSTSGNTPFLSANDRSRWSTIRTLVDQHTFELDDVIFRDGRRDKDWHSIDLVRHKGRDGREHYYSSKPPLLTALLAVEYWCVREITAASLSNQPLYVGRIMLIVSNVVPLGLALLLLASCVERHGTSDWGRVFVMAAACFGTMLTTIAVTLTNHLPGAIGALVAAVAFLRIYRPAPSPPASDRWFFLAGIGAGFLTANELPALCAAALFFAALFLRNRRATLLCYTPPLTIVLGLLLALNYAAHASWRPAYAHRGDGSKLFELTKSGNDLQPGQISPSLRDSLGPSPPIVSTEAVLTKLDDARWMLWDEVTQTRLVLRPVGSTIAVHAWDDWYRYEGTYWVPERLAGVDRGEPSVATYAFQILLGHHGILSLTPIWILSVWGAWCWHRSGTPGQRWLARITIAASVICLLFYTLGRPTIDRNYGGVTCGFRWMYWFIPWWLLMMLPALDALSANDAEHPRRRSLGRAVAIGLLAISAFSAAYPSSNPWTHPWIYEYWQHIGWIE